MGIDEVRIDEVGIIITNIIYRYNQHLWRAHKVESTSKRRIENTLLVKVVIIIKKQVTTLGDDKSDPKKSNVVEEIESERDEFSDGFEVHQSSPMENNGIEEIETTLKCTLTQLSKILTVKL